MIHAKNIKRKNAHYSITCFCLALLLLCLTVAELLKIKNLSSTAPPFNHQAQDLLNPDKEKIQQYLNHYRHLAEKLSQKNSFVTQSTATVAVPDPPPDCSAILGDQALIGDQWFKVGDTVADAKVLTVESTHVTLEWLGREITRKPVLTAQNNSRNQSSSNQHHLILNLDLTDQLIMGPQNIFNPMNPNRFHQTLSLMSVSPVLQNNKSLQDLLLFQPNPPNPTSKIKELQASVNP